MEPDPRATAHVFSIALLSSVRQENRDLTVYTISRIRPLWKSPAPIYRERLAEDMLHDGFFPRLVLFQAVWLILGVESAYSFLETASTVVGVCYLPACSAGWLFVLHRSSNGKAAPHSSASLRV